MNKKTRQQIEMDFAKAISQAQALEQMADDLSRIANNEVASAFLVLKNSWRGDAGGSMEPAGKEAVNEIYRTADNLIRVARNIRSTADLVYRAEKSAVELCI